MRKFFLIAGALAAFALFAGTPAEAAVGCECVKLGHAPICVSGVSECMNRVGGVCLAPCSMSEREKMTRVRAHPRKVALRDTTDIDEKPVVRVNTKRHNKAIRDTVEVDEKPLVRSKTRRHDTAVRSKVEVERVVVDDKPKKRTKVAAKSKSKPKTRQQ